MPTRPPVHRAPEHHTPAETKRAADQWRGSAASRGYDHHWRRFRALILTRDPICRDCRQRGDVTPTQEVHHLIKLRDRPDLRLDAANVIGLCASCHSTRTGRGE